VYLGIHCLDSITLCVVIYTNLGRRCFGKLRKPYCSWRNRKNGVALHYFSKLTSSRILEIIEIGTDIADSSCIGDVTEKSTKFYKKHGYILVLRCSMRKYRYVGVLKIEWATEWTKNMTYPLTFDRSHREKTTLVFVIFVYHFLA